MSEPPALRVVRGNPTDEELAALVLALRQLARQPKRATTRSRWVEESRSYPTWDAGPWR